MKKEPIRRDVSLSAELYSRVEARVTATDFGTVDEYVTFVLEEVLKDERQEAKPGNKEEEEEVKRRLRALGYLK